MCNFISETDKFLSSVTEESFKANHKLYFNKKFLASATTYNGFKKQHINQATNSFTQRSSNY